MLYNLHVQTRLDFIASDVPLFKKLYLWCLRGLYHLYVLKNVKNTHGWLILLVKFRIQLETFFKYHSSMGVFHVFKIAQMDSNRAKRLICSLAIKVHDGDFIITTVARRLRLAFNKAKKLFQHKWWREKSSFAFWNLASNDKS